MQRALKRDPSSRPHEFRPSPHSWSNGATNCARKGGNVFHIVFKRGEALPLTFVRFWRPRRSRGEGEAQPRHASDSGPRQQPFRESDSLAHRPHGRTLHLRPQSVTAFSPRTQTQQETVQNRSHTLDSTYREQASAMKKNFPQPVRNLEPSALPVASHIESICDSKPAGKRPPHRIGVSVLLPIQFTVRVRNIPSHEHF